MLLAHNHFYLSDRVDVAVLTRFRGINESQEDDPLR